MLADQVREFSLPHAINLFHLAANFGGDLLWRVQRIVIDNYFQVYICTHKLGLFSFYVTMEVLPVITCKICKIRRPRRYCPGVDGDICSICCGTEREVTVSCPFECEYLQDARIREKTPLTDPKEFPNKDIRITDEFLTRHEGVLLFLTIALVTASLDLQGIIDYDVREGLAALIQTYRTLEAGLYYESKPTNPMAAHIYKAVQDAIVTSRRRLEEAGSRTLRDAEILGILVFLQRLEIQHNNGRRKGRAFIDFLRAYFPAKQAALEL